MMPRVGCGGVWASNKDKAYFTYIDGMIELLCIDRLQHWHNNSQQLFRIFESLHIEVHSAALGIQSIQLAPTDIACWQRRNRLGVNRSLSNNSLPLGLIETVRCLARCWPLAISLVKDLEARAMHALQILLYASVDLIFGVPVHRGQPMIRVRRKCVHTSS
jgi:hypothetical protein